MQNHSVYLSILIPTYERKDYLIRCLDSIDYHEEVEVIVSDNASSYDVHECIPNHLNDICIVRRNAENIGPRENIFQASRLPKGRYTLYLTDDDYFLPGELALLIRKLRNSDVKVFYASCIVELVKSRRRKYYGGLPRLLGRAGLIARSHVLSGLIVRTDFLRHLLEIYPNLLRATWYFSVAVVCAVPDDAWQMEDRPALVHTWENETFWGIDSGDHETLRESERELYDFMRKEELINTFQWSFLHFQTTHLGILFVAAMHKINRQLKSAKYTACYCS